MTSCQWILISPMWVLAVMIINEDDSRKSCPLYEMSVHKMLTPLGLFGISQTEHEADQNLTSIYIFSPYYGPAELCESTFIYTV